MGRGRKEEWTHRHTQRLVTAEMEMIQLPSFKLEMVNAVRMNVNNNKMNEVLASNHTI